jgi:hypothetical protein
MACARAAAPANNSSRSVFCARASTGPQLTDDPVGELALELASACAENAHAGGSRAFSGGRDKTRLSYSRGTLDHYETPRALARGGNGVVERLKLGLALEQLSSRLQSPLAPVAPKT